MTSDLHPRARRLGLLIASLLTLSLLAGCLAGDEDPEPTAGDEDTDGTMDDDDMGADPPPADGEEPPPAEEEPEEEPEPCTASTARIHEWGFDGPALPDPASVDPEGDPTMLLAVTGAETFTVENGTISLTAGAMVGNFITLGFTVQLLDPSGGTAFTFEGAAGPSVDGVTGESPTASSTILAPAPGEWTVAWSLTGYIEGLQVTFDAETCS